MRDEDESQEFKEITRMGKKSDWSHFERGEDGRRCRTGGLVNSLVKTLKSKH